MLELILDYGTNAINKDDILRALSYASEQGRAKAVQLLLDRGVNINAHAPPGGRYLGPPLLAAAHNKHTNLVQLLLDLGANTILEATVTESGGKTALVLSKSPLLMVMLRQCSCCLVVAPIAASTTGVSTNSPYTSLQ